MTRQYYIHKPRYNKSLSFVLINYPIGVLYLTAATTKSTSCFSWSIIPNKDCSLPVYYATSLQHVKEQGTENLTRTQLLTGGPMSNKQQFQAWLAKTETNLKRKKWLIASSQDQRQTQHKGTFSFAFSKSTANFKPRSAVSGSPFAVVARIDLNIRFGIWREKVTRTAPYWIIVLLKCFKSNEEDVQIISKNVLFQELKH